MSPRASADLAISRYEALGLRDQRAAFRAIQQEALKRCARDGLFFLSFVRTRDEVDPEHSVKPFPIHLDYIRQLWTDITEHPKIVIAKSRQMIVSWVACAFAVWSARRAPNQYVVLQTQNWPDATKLVSVAGGDKDAAYLGRCQFIERHLPRWLRVRTKEQEGMLAYPDLGSVIEALPGGADKIRGKVPSVAILDEFATHEEAWGEWTALAPLVQKAAKVIIISTPNGGEGNCFFHLYHGTPRSVPQSR